MDIFKEHKITIKWEKDGNFGAEITNGAVTKLNMCEPGKDGQTSPCQCLTSTNWKFINDVRDCLSELINTVKEQQIELGYSFPTDEKIKEI